jgi:hypothetical protein
MIRVALRPGTSRMGIHTKHDTEPPPSPLTAVPPPQRSFHYLRVRGPVSYRCQNVPVPCHQNRNIGRNWKLGHDFGLSLAASRRLEQRPASHVASMARGCRGCNLGACVRGLCGPIISPAHNLKRPVALWRTGPNLNAG